MMTVPPQLGGTLPIYQDGVERCDSGKKVIVNSVGGAIDDDKGLVVDESYGSGFRDAKPKEGPVDRIFGHALVSHGRALEQAEGIVYAGPYRMVFEGKSKIDENGKKMKHPRRRQFVTEPYWCVRMQANGFYLHLSEKELTFV